MRPVILRSKHAQINALFRGAARGFPAPREIGPVGLRPGRRRLPGSVLRDAAASGTRAHAGLAARAKAVFLSWQYNWADDLFARHGDGVLMVWNGIKGHRKLLADAARAHGWPVAFFERAPLPGRVAVDFSGVNHGCSLPRDPAFYAAWAEGWGGEVTAWRNLRAEITPRARIRPGDVPDAAPPGLDDGRFVFVPLQVPGDSQLTVYGDWMRRVETMVDTLAAAAHALPDGWHVRVKEHPSARVSLASRIAARSHDKFRSDDATDTMTQAAASAAVLTVNSSVGLEAFFLDKPVMLLGHAFYGFDGLAQKVDGPDDLRKLLADPGAWSFDQAARDRFMAYLAAEYFPPMADVQSGCFTLADAAARDRRRDAILERLGG